MAEFAVYLGSSGTSQNIQIINGKMSVSKSVNYSFMATKIGKFTIPPAQIEYNGKIYKSAPIEIEVLAQSSTKPQTNPGTRRQQTPDRDNQSSIEDNLYERVVLFTKKPEYHVTDHFKGKNHA